MIYLRKAKDLGLTVIDEYVEPGRSATIVLDDERAPFVQLAFELYDTGDYTLDELADEL